MEESGIAVWFVICCVIVILILLFLQCCSGRDRPVQQENESFIRFESRQRQDGHILDLHGYSVKQAESMIRNFVQRKKTMYLNGWSREGRYISIITGRGSHSVGQIPVIKRAAQNLIEDMGYNFTWSNPGMMKVDLEN